MVDFPKQFSDGSATVDYRILPDGVNQLLAPNPESRIAHTDALAKLGDCQIKENLCKQTLGGMVQNRKSDNPAVVIPTQTFQLFSNDIEFLSPNKHAISRNLKKWLYYPVILCAK